MPRDNKEQEEKEEEAVNEKEEIDESVEQAYRLAMDDEIAKFYFQNCPGEYDRRKDMLAACIKKNNINRAVELIDMMADTKSNEGYDDLNGWGRQNMLTIMYLIRLFDYTNEDSWETEGITDEMRQVAKQLVYRMLPHLPSRSQEELKKDLYRINPDIDDSEDYIKQLLEDADVYTTFPKPRGKGGAPNINRMSDEFIHCFERLSKMGRLDIVSEIMLKFAAVRDVLKPVTYELWVSFMAHDLKDGDLTKVFRNSPEIFEEWLQVDSLRDSDIKSVAQSLGEHCSREEFMTFRNMVISHKGMVSGLDANSERIKAFNVENTLIVANDGRPFNEADIMAICRSGASKKQRGSSIGYRGVGFKSATSISTEIVIYSADVYFTFSKRLCAKTLGKEEDSVPTVRIPFLYDENTLDKSVHIAIDRCKKDGYTTFFIFRNADINRFVKEIKEFDAGWLIFLSKLSHVDLDCGIIKDKCVVSRKHISESEQVLKIIGSGERWYLISKYGVSLAFKYDPVIGVLPSSAEEGVFHCFLPTLDKTGFPFKANADFL